MTERTFPVNGIDLKLHGNIATGSLANILDFFNDEIKALQAIILEQDAELEEQKSEIALLESLIHKDSVAYCDNFAKFQKQIRDLESARLADAELANAHAQKQNKIIFELEAVQEKLAENLAFANGILNDEYGGERPEEAEEVINKIRHELGKEN